MRKLLAVLLAATMVLGLAVTAHADLAQEDLSGQEFLTDKAQAQTYINPLPLDYQRSGAGDKGMIPDNPFSIGQMIGNEGIPNNPVESITHIRFQDLFRGTSTYIAENDTRATRALGEDLKSLFDLEDHRGDPRYSSYEECARQWFSGFPQYDRR